MFDYFVFIMESPKPQDLFEGRLEGRVLYEMLQLAEVPVEYRLVANADQFRRGLGEMQDQMGTHQGLPLLHISAHGNKDCIVLTEWCGG